MAEARVPGDIFHAATAGFKLRGYFSRLSGTGNVAVGGNAVRCRVARVRVHGGRAGGARGQLQARRRARETRQLSPPVSRRTVAGSYTIEGVTLRIRYDDGSQEQRIIVTDPSDPTVIWLDGEGYTHH